MIVLGFSVEIPTIIQGSGSDASCKVYVRQSNRAESKTMVNGDGCANPILTAVGRVYHRENRGERHNENHCEDNRRPYTGGG